MIINLAVNNKLINFIAMMMKYTLDTMAVRNGEVYIL